MASDPTRTCSKHITVPFKNKELLEKVKKLPNGGKFQPCSPFTIDETGAKFGLVFFPNGHQPSTTGCCLLFLFAELPPKMVSMVCRVQFALIEAGASWCGTSTFKKGQTGFAWNTDVLKTKDIQHLDCMTFYIRISVLDETYFNTYSFPSEEIPYNWAPSKTNAIMIKPITSYKYEDSIESPVFEQGGFKWFLKVYPMGRTMPRNRMISSTTSTVDWIAYGGPVISLHLAHIYHIKDIIANFIIFFDEDDASKYCGKENKRFLVGDMYSCMKLTWNLGEDGDRAKLEEILKQKKSFSIQIKPDNATYSNRIFSNSMSAKIDKLQKEIDEIKILMMAKQDKVKDNDDEKKDEK